MALDHGSVGIETVPGDLWPALERALALKLIAGQEFGPELLMHAERLQRHGADQDINVNRLRPYIDMQGPFIHRLGLSQSDMDVVLPILHLPAPEHIKDTGPVVMAGLRFSQALDTTMGRIRQALWGATQTCEAYAIDIAKATDVWSYLSVSTMRALKGSMEINIKPVMADGSDVPTDDPSVEFRKALRDDIKADMVAIHQGMHFCVGRRVRVHLDFPTGRGHSTKPRLFLAIQGNNSAYSQPLEVDLVDSAMDGFALLTWCQTQRDRLDIASGCETTKRLLGAIAGHNDQLTSRNPLKATLENGSPSADNDGSEKSSDEEDLDSDNPSDSCSVVSTARADESGDGSTPASEEASDVDSEGTYGDSSPTPTQARDPVSWPTGPSAATGARAPPSFQLSHQQAKDLPDRDNELKPEPVSPGIPPMPGGQLLAAGGDTYPTLPGLGYQHQQYPAVPFDNIQSQHQLRLELNDLLRVVPLGEPTSAHGPPEPVIAHPAPNATVVVNGHGYEVYIAPDTENTLHANKHARAHAILHGDKAHTMSLELPSHELDPERCPRCGPFGEVRKAAENLSRLFAVPGQQHGPVVDVEGDFGLLFANQRVQQPLPPFQAVPKTLFGDPGTPTDFPEPLVSSQQRSGTLPGAPQQFVTVDPSLLQLKPSYFVEQAQARAAMDDDSVTQVPSKRKAEDHFDSSGRQHKNFAFPDQVCGNDRHFMPTIGVAYKPSSEHPSGYGSGYQLNFNFGGVDLGGNLTSNAVAGPGPGTQSAQEQRKVAQGFF